MLVSDDHLRRSIAYGARVRSGWVPLDKLSQKSSPFVGKFLTPRHKQIALAPGGMNGMPFALDLGIPGYLLRADALKIYELAYTASGDVLELGTFKGLSASVIAHALEDRGSGLLETVDIDDDSNVQARAYLDTLPGGERVTFTLKDAAERMDELTAEGRKFGYVFIDHWHGYDVTRAACERLPALLNDGACVQFHDFSDASNSDPDHIYGVYQAVLDTLCEDARFSFEGLCGCTAVFRYSS